MTLPIQHQRLHISGLDLHVVTAGPEDGPPVLLLHGFPENWTSWRHQLAPLASAGFRVLAPDLRGYGESARPRGIRPYHLRHLMADVAELARSTGRPVHVVGHDWGGLIAWTFAGRHPELLNRLVILNAPHPGLYLKKAWRPPQLPRSLYVLFFQLPWLPERSLSRRGYAAVRAIFRKLPTRPGAFTEEDIEAYVRSLAPPGALTAALNYYRANLLTGGLFYGAQSRTDAATLILWGEQDPALDLELLEGIPSVAPRARVHRFPDAGHWIQNEAPAEVNELLLDFLQE